MEIKRRIDGKFGEEKTNLTSGTRSKLDGGPAR